MMSSHCRCGAPSPSWVSLVVALVRTTGRPDANPEGQYRVTDRKNVSTAPIRQSRTVVCANPCGPRRHDAKGSYPSIAVDNINPPISTGEDATTRVCSHRRTNRRWDAPPLKMALNPRKPGRCDTSAPLPVTILGPFKRTLVSPGRRICQFNGGSL